MAKKYIVRLTEHERIDLESLIHKGKVAAHKRLHAEILLKADVSDLAERWPDKQISETFGISTRTVERVRERLVRKGLESALNRAAPTRARKRKIDGENELKPWQNKEWCIPAKQNAEFVCAMEDVLDVYKGSCDERHPLICMDESSKQHIKEIRQPIPAKPGSVEKYDTEYERNGVSNLFMFFEPLDGKRHVAVTDQRTALDWAHQIRHLVDVLYPRAERIACVLDNLNTHTGASLHKALPPEEAEIIR